MDARQWHGLRRQIANVRSNLYFLTNTLLDHKKEAGDVLACVLRMEDELDTAQHALGLIKPADTTHALFSPEKRS